MPTKITQSTYNTIHNKQSNNSNNPQIAMRFIATTAHAHIKTHTHTYTHIESARARERKRDVIYTALEILAAVTLGTILLMFLDDM